MKLLKSINGGKEMNELEKQGRMYFIDKLRTFLVILVVFYHALITYGGFFF